MATITECKFVVVGDGGVGKSASVIQLTQHHFLDEFDPTIQDSYRTQFRHNGSVYLLDVLDTAPQDEYNAYTDQWTRMAQGFVIMYTITSRRSFEEVNSFHEQILRVKDADTFPMVLVGNKCDLEDERQVTTEEGRELARLWGIPFMEASARNRINIEEQYHALIDLASEGLLALKITEFERKKGRLSWWQVKKWNDLDKQMKQLKFQHATKDLRARMATVQQLEKLPPPLAPPKPDTPTETDTEAEMCKHARTLLGDEETSDMIFVVDGHAVCAHRAIVSVRCKFLAETIRIAEQEQIEQRNTNNNNNSNNNNNAGSDNNNTKVTVTVEKGVKLAVFRALLQFLYSGTVTASECYDVAGELWSLADLYGLRELVTMAHIVSCNDSIPSVLTEKCAAVFAADIGKLYNNDNYTDVTVIVHEDDNNNSNNNSNSNNSNSNNNTNKKRWSVVTLSPLTTRAPVTTKSFRLHKIILQSRCDYFKGLLAQRWKSTTTTTTVTATPTPTTTTTTSTTTGARPPSPTLSSSSSSSSSSSASSAENSNAVSNNIYHISDMRVKVFEALVRFLYTGHVSTKLDTSVAGELLVVANQYNLVTLRKQCEGIICDTSVTAPQIDKETVLDIYADAKMHLADYVTKYCVYLMSQPKFYEYLQENQQYLLHVDKETREGIETQYKATVALETEKASLSQQMKQIKLDMKKFEKLT